MLNDRVSLIKSHLKSSGITYEQLSKESNIPLNTLKNIFSGRTKNPRIDTIQAIERALGIDDRPAETQKAESELIASLNELTEEELVELSSFIDFIISKRK